MKKIVVFASGSGTNFQKIADELHHSVCDIAMLICDKPGAYCIERAKKLNIPTFVFNPKEYENKAAFETDIITTLSDIDPDLIVLAGYMRIIGSTLLDKYEGRIINIHPALLPAFPGAHGIEDAYNYGVKIMGVSVHYVDAGIDTGKIIDQDCFKRTGGETLEEIETKIHELEYEIYPRVIKQLLST
ncbi:MAG TPA: phosphoribosylglycinamide formyltransferase [Firmicutes bacterium]|nr:phosphoribosylglycinamide formyltransferase [Bacillota bacterium]